MRVTDSGRVTLHRDRSSAGKDYWHLIDAHGRSVWPFLDFIIACVDTHQFSAKTIEGRAYAIFQLYTFLHSRNLDTWDVDDKVLLEFRDHRANAIAKNASGDLRARQRAVNLELRNIYTYFAWLQSDQLHGASGRHFGAVGCKITSSLLQARQTVHGRAMRLRSRDSYPLCFRNAGERSKHRMGFVPGEEHRALLTEYFFASYPPSIARRNCLIFELAWHVGWRRGSILSLRTSDFDSARVDSDEDLWIRPEAQKFGYCNAFLVNYRVAAQILDYIDNERELIAAKWPVRCSHVFLSSRTGEALSPGATSCIFSRARTALGWPRGAGLHAWRRGFTNEFLEREIDARLELGWIPEVRPSRCPSRARSGMRA